MGVYLAWLADWVCLRASLFSPLLFWCPLAFLGWSMLNIIDKHVNYVQYIKGYLFIISF